MNLTEISQISHKSRVLIWAGRFALGVLRYAVICFLGVFVLYLSMVTTSSPMTAANRQKIERAIDVLDSKGFTLEAFLLRRVATFRGDDNWLNVNLVDGEQAYASTNFPFGIITIHPDFYDKAVDETERAAILLHEVRHLQGGDEEDAYSYVWQNRERLGWTMRSHGTTESYITIEQQTRDFAPSLFTCTEQPWRDCTLSETGDKRQETKGCLKNPNSRE